jgi:hypothetical protein
VPWDAKLIATKSVVVVNANGRPHHRTHLRAIPWAISLP